MSTPKLVGLSDVYDTGYENAYVEPPPWQWNPLTARVDAHATAVDDAIRHVVAYVFKTLAEDAADEGLFAATFVDDGMLEVAWHEGLDQWLTSKMSEYLG